MGNNTIQVTLQVDDQGSVSLKKFSGQAQQSFKEVEVAAKKTTDGMAKGWQEAGRAFLAYMSVQQVVAFGKSVIDLGDALHTTSERTGVSVQMLDKLRQIGEQNNVTFDEISNSMKFLGKNITEAGAAAGPARDMLEALGLNIGDLLKLNPEQRFLAVGKAIGKLGDEGEKSLAAMTLLGGRGGDALKLVFNDLEGALSKVTAVMTKDQARAWDDFNDNMSKMKNALITVANTIMTDWVPAITKMWDVLYGKVGDPKKLLLGELNAELAKQQKVLGAIEGTNMPGKKWWIDDISAKIDLLREKIRILNQDIRTSEEVAGLGGPVSDTPTKLNLKDQKAIDDAKKLAEEKLKLTEAWAEMYFTITNNAYNTEIYKLDVILKKLREKGVITSAQSDEYKGLFDKKYFSVDSRFGGGLDEAEMQADRDSEAYAKQVKEAKKWEAQIAQINASVTGDKKAMMVADLAMIESEERPLEMSIEMWNRLAEAKRKAVEIKYQSDWVKWANSAKTSMEQLEATAISAAESFSSGFVDAFVEFQQGTKSAKDAFLDFARSFLIEIQKMIMKQMILNALKSGSQSGGWMGGIMGLFGGGGTDTSALGSGSTAYPTQVGGGSAFGNIFGPGGKYAFADGGIVNRPTMFAFSKGTGVMGEAGPEAIMPLGRDSKGRLGVRGGGGNNVNVNINVDGSKGGTREQNDKMAKQIAREVREEVKKIIADERRYGGALGAQTARAY